MEIKKFNIDEYEFEFVNESYDTRNGFKHVSTLFMNNCKQIENTCHYLNRTWESYRYQTAMRGCVYMLIENRIGDLKSNFKNRNGYLKMTAKRNEEFENEIKDDDILGRYYRLLSRI